MRTAASAAACLCRLATLALHLLETFALTAMHGVATNCDPLLLLDTPRRIHLVYDGVPPQVKLCREAIVPELRTAREPTAASTPEEQQAYAGYLDRLQANSATQLACYL